MKLFRKLKVLEVNNEYFIGSRGYSLYKYSFENDKCSCIGHVKDKYSFLSYFFLTRRLFRAEINNLYTLSNGDQVVVAKKGLFRKGIYDIFFKKCFSIKRGTKPLNLCITPYNDIYWGEYFQNIEKNEVHIYHSSDFGKSWNVVYTFPKGEINHIHGIFWDKYADCIWIVTGDREDECIIANTKDNFKSLNIIFRGGQEFRATVLLFYEDAILFGTDSQYIQNEIKRIDRKTLAITSIKKIQGSVIKGGQFENVACISTTVEPSMVNKDKCSHLWFTRNGSDWKEIYSDEKDCLPSIFQFGCLEFPRYTSPIKNTLFFTGRALKHTDGCSVMMHID